MLKKIKKALILGMIPLSMSFLSSCSFFNTEEKGYLIKSIETEECEDGSTKVTITYDDEDQAPIVFYIPKGEKGEDGETGNGIAGITNKGTDETGSYTIMEITYTDTTMEPLEFQVPNGVSVKSMESVVNEETGISTVTLTLTNGETLSFELERGKDGEDGRGIESIEWYVNEDEESEDYKSVEIVLVLSDGFRRVIQIPAPQKGEDGRGISSMIAGESGEKYIIIVNYTDGNSETLEFAKPADPATWLNGQGAPNSTLGRNGDFYFDTYGKNIYSKSNGRWILIHSFSDNDIVYEIRFDLNDSRDYPASMTAEPAYFIDRGSYFTASGYSIPIPTRSGYTFDGWFTTKTPGPVNGAFTDLTPVFSDLTLYAKWIEC